MDAADLRNLILGGPGPAQEWAELGSGEGNFTLALAALLGEAGRVHSIDRDGGAIARQVRRLRAAALPCQVLASTGDFRLPLDLANLDGVLMANSLHFVADKPPVLDLIRSYLRPGGGLLVVEYDTDLANPWVPHPFSFQTWSRLAEAAGFESTRLLGRYQGRSMHGMYSAFSAKPQ